MSFYRDNMDLQSEKREPAGTRRATNNILKSDKMSARRRQKIGSRNTGKHCGVETLTQNKDPIFFFRD
jgi:hypothetical protein